jgi:hypothetical protein
MGPRQLGPFSNGNQAKEVVMYITMTQKMMNELRTMLFSNKFTIDGNFIDIGKDRMWIPVESDQKLISLNQLWFRVNDEQIKTLSGWIALAYIRQVTK